jgi:hypothetical protein
MTTASITYKTRMTVQDMGRPFASQVPINGTANVFDLPVESISATANPPTVILNGVDITNQATPTYVIDYKYGVISFFEAPQPSGPGTLQVIGTTYDFFDDDEVQEAVTDAFNMHTADLDPMEYIDPIPGECGLPQVQEILVAYLAAVELLFFRANDSSQEIDINTPEGVSMRRSQRWEQISQQIQMLQAQYQLQSAALGVGLYRIQVLNQRRVSYTTNRLVPIFREQEYNAPYTGFTPTTGLPGSIINIMGKYFTAATQVTFGGVPATQFNILSDTHIQAYVPAGGQTGQIGILTPYGMVLSTAQFVVGEPPPFIDYGPEWVHIPIPPGK